MFIEVFLFQGSVATINLYNLIKITKDVNGFAVFKMSDGSEIKTTNKYDNILSNLKNDGKLK